LQLYQLVIKLKWIFIFMGVFLFAWLISGMVMLLPSGWFGPEARAGGYTIDYRAANLSPADAIARIEARSGVPLEVASVRLQRIRDQLLYAVKIRGGEEQLVDASTGIAEITGLGTGFVGTALLSVVTSLPELLAALAAMRMNAFDMAVGNLFGSSVFNMLGVGIADFFYTDGRFLAAIDPGFALVALLGMLLTNMALLGNLARVERKILFLELDTIAIVGVYVFGMYLLFSRGIGL